VFQKGENKIPIKETHNTLFIDQHTRWSFIQAPVFRDFASRYMFWFFWNWNI